jgi:hypothetical protein
MSVAPLRFTDQGGIDKLMLIEVPDALLGALTTGDVLYLRGQENEDAMVCTSDTSFILRQTETSHTCFLVPHLQPQPADAAAAAGTAAAPTETVSSTDGYPANHIAGLVTCHYDLLPAPARTGALRALFRGGPLTRQHDAQLAALADAVLAARATAAPDAPLGVTDSDIDSLLGFPDSLAASQAAKRPRLAATDSSSSSASAAATVALSLTASVAAVSSGGLPALTGRTLRDLGHLVQASDSALRAAVAAVPLLRVGRAFCAVARDLTSDIVDGVLNVIGSLALDPARVSTETLLAELRADGVCSLFTAAHTLYALADWPATDALNAEPQPLTLQTPAHVDAVDAVAASAAAATADAEAARQQQRYEQRLSHWRSVQAEPTPLGSAAAALARHSHADGDAPLPAGIVPGTAAADATAFAPSLRLPRRLALSTTKLARHRAETVLRSQKQVPAKQFLAYVSPFLSLRSYLWSKVYFLT